MKTIICLFLVLILPLSVFAEVTDYSDGIDIGAYTNKLKTYFPDHIASERDTFDTRDVFILATGNSKTLAVTYGYTFEHSDTIECVISTGLNYKFIGNSISAMLPANTKNRDDMVVKLITQLSSLSGDKLISFEWNTNISIENYYLDLIPSSQKNAPVFIFMRHKNSMLKDKQEAMQIINFNDLPLDEIVKDLERENETTAAKIVSLSSGTWDCPAHISAGEYRVIPLKSANIFVWRGDNLIASEYLNTADDDEIGRLVLQSGDRIEISGGKLSFKPF